LIDLQNFKFYYVKKVECIDDYCTYAKQLGSQGRNGTPLQQLQKAGD